MPQKNQEESVLQCDGPAGFSFLFSKSTSTSKMEHYDVFRESLDQAVIAQKNSVF